MPDTPTPGELAYVAYVQVRYGMPATDAALTYVRTIPEERAAWDAAAQAVIVHYEEGVQQRASLDMLRAQQRGPANNA